MNFIYIIFLLQSTIASFYERSRARDQLYQDVIYKEHSVPSQLACMQLCRFRDTQALVAYHNGLCQCLKRSSQDDEKKETLIGLVMEPKEIVKMEKNAHPYPGTYKLESKNIRNKAIAYRPDKSDVYIKTYDSQNFKIVPAYNGVEGVYSLEPMFKPDYVINIEGERAVYTKKVDIVNKDDASFYIRKNRFFEGYMALELYSSPNNFLGHVNFRIGPIALPTSDVLKQNASFKMFRMDV